MLDAPSTCTKVPAKVAPMRMTGRSMSVLPISEFAHFALGLFLICSAHGKSPKHEFGKSSFDFPFSWPFLCGKAAIHAHRVPSLAWDYLFGRNSMLSVLLACPNHSQCHCCYHHGTKTARPAADVLLYQLF